LLVVTGVKARAFVFLAGALASASCAVGPAAPSAQVSVPAVDVSPVDPTPIIVTLHPHAPTLAAISPPSGLPGTVVDVELSGTNFVPLKTTVEIVTTPRDPIVNVRVRDDTTITATIAIPAGSTPRTHNIVVITPGGVSERRQFVVRAPNAQLPVIGAFGATPASILKGAGATLDWTGIRNATSCEIDNGVGAVSCSGGNKGVVPKYDTAYRLTAIGPGGYANATAGVRVSVGTPAPMTHGTQAFHFTGGMQTFTVPMGVTQVRVEALGAQGGSSETDDVDDGAEGDETDATIDVAPGDNLVVVVGGEGGTPKHDFEPGAGGFGGGADAAMSEHAGGGGGGESDVRQGGMSMADRVVVAGGGRGHESADGGKGGNGGGSAHASEKAHDVDEKPGKHKGNGQVTIKW
jgi:hypothetical protein